ncbi:hypothetical protein PM3016_6776 [Paenibacillus mucilaginosus 3016]|uniref:Uncharacterized protein n=1 Tax=Paenibacillus mucilaginosus 3016 TaxID=1116391 RepID=H6NPM6_9BACL|nr:hypothetical protein PM3016_6776 [Paenibacillus mucilaginosus 3016]
MTEFSILHDRGIRAGKAVNGTAGSRRWWIFESGAGELALAQRGIKGIKRLDVGFVPKGAEIRGYSEAGSMA